MSSENKELLEAVALIAGVKGKYQHWEDSNDRVSCGIAPDGRPGREWWNPLKDDSEAFKLAVDFGIGASYLDREKRVVITMPHGFTYAVSNLREKYDKYAATRRAIVKAVINLSKMGKV